jgi:hypothetical protein
MVIPLTHVALILREKNNKRKTMMSKQGMTVTVLATGLAEAIQDDEANGEGFDISAGMFGINLSNWIREVAQELNRE